MLEMVENYDSGILEGDEEIMINTTTLTIVKANSVQPYNYDDKINKNPLMHNKGNPSKEDLKKTEIRSMLTAL